MARARTPDPASPSHPLQRRGRRTNSRRNSAAVIAPMVALVFVHLAGIGGDGRRALRVLERAAEAIR